MKLLPVLAALAGATAANLCAPAQAQTPYRGHTPPAGYGGGLIEFLMTGANTQGAPRGQVASRAAVAGADPFDAYEGPDPSRGSRRYAGLPASPEAGLVRREPDPMYRRQVVGYDGPEAPGTIVVDTPSRFLYLVGGGGSAVRYGIGVGRPGFEWAGVKTVTQKREWPGWTPPPQMRLRRPDLPGHMAGGPDNPLGARALYLGSSLYRIHGTNEPWTIGQNVSSGCIRMLNADVVDLYERVRVGTRVKVI